MALSYSMTLALKDILKPGMRMASMGYPDMIAPPEMLRELVGEDFDGIVYRGDSEAICRRHGLAPRLIHDAHSFFEARGCRLDVFDIVQERRCEILLDLNEPILTRLHSAPKVDRFAYDIVLDVGTIEHCFNIAQAVFNIADLAAEGGYVIHENPFNCGNHGFYSLNPTFYEDFYRCNGFEVLKCALVTKDGRGADVSRTKRFQFTGEECNVFAMARRVETKPLVFPVQTKYAKLIPAAGVPGESTKEVAHG
jgi:hypothetical protein